MRTAAIDWTKEELQEAFEVRDGKLWRKEYVDSRGNRYPQSPVKASVGGYGYIRVSLKGGRVGYHTIVWTLTYGNIPDGYTVDHIDGDRSNNNINNLRLVTKRQNGQNMKVHRQGRLAGCSYHKQHKRWIALIQVEGRRLFLGYFPTEQEAHQAYLDALEKHGFSLVGND